MNKYIFYHFVSSDTILGNNSTMKLQYERIVKWQSDVQKVHQTHREKMIEAKDFIEKVL